jgi:predicted SAM-dependent methyltransferase
MPSEYIQFGCGLCAPPSWRNFDAGPAFWLQKRLPLLRPMLLRRGFPDYPVERIEYADVIQGLPLKPGAARAIYCSHVLEHMALEEFRTTLRNVFTYLQPGGRFRLVVPDLEFIAKQYLEDASDQASSNFMQTAHLGERHHMRGLRAIPQALFGRAKHFWMWDYRTIAPELAAAGFVGIRRAQFGDSEEPRFNELEEIGRWKDCLGVECLRP